MESTLARGLRCRLRCARRDAMIAPSKGGDRSVVPTLERTVSAKFLLNSGERDAPEDRHRQSSPQRTEGAGELHLAIHCADSVPVGCKKRCPTWRLRRAKAALAVQGERQRPRSAPGLATIGRTTQFVRASGTQFCGSLNGAKTRPSALPPRCRMTFSALIRPPRARERFAIAVPVSVN